MAYYLFRRFNTALTVSVCALLLSTSAWGQIIGGGGVTPTSACGDSSHALGWTGSAFNCPTITGTAGSYPTGVTSQIAGYNAANAAEAQTVGGDCSYARTGAGTAQLICLKTNGVAFVSSATTDTTNAANISSGTLPAARLPNPSASTLGGVQSKAAVSHNFLTSISTSGVPAAAQPASTDLSDIPIPFASGGTGSSTAATSAQIPVGNAGGTAYVPKTVSGDATLSNAGALTVTKTNGSSFAASATTDTTNATNITSGTLDTARLPSPFTSGTASGNTSVFGTTSGATTSGHAAAWDVNGNLVDSGGAAGVPTGGACGGDLASTFPNCTVASVLGGTSIGTVVSLGAPSVGAIAGFTGLEQWEPHALPTTSGSVTCKGTAGTYPFNDAYVGQLTSANVSLQVPAPSACSSGSIISFLVLQSSSAARTFAVTEASNKINGTPVWSIGATAGNVLLLQYINDGSFWDVFTGGTYPAQPQPVSGGGTGLATLTAHALYAGNGTSAPTAVGPGSTSGVPLIAQGASSDPVYGTALVAGGGTGLTTLTAHALYAGNGTSAPTAIGPDSTTGKPLISQGSSSDPAYGSASWSYLTTATSPLEDAPMWMHFFGSAFESDPNISGTTTIQGLHYYTNLTVQGGGTLQVGNTQGSASTAADVPRYGLIAVVPGTCTIAGTITADAIQGNSGGVNGNGGGASGGGGFGTGGNAAAAGTASIWFGGTTGEMEAGGAVGSSGVAGGNCTATFTTSDMNFISANVLGANYLGGAAGGQGQNQSGSIPKAGGGIVLVCGSIVGTGGTITAAGANGTNGGVAIGGQGGAGGGFVIQAARSYTNQITPTVTGGSGGTIGSGTSTAGGSGCNGWHKEFTLN